MTRPTAGGYDPRHFSALFDVEDRHFWFRARNLALQSVIAPIAARLPVNYRVLEIGCGTGKALQALEAACPNARVVVGMDPFIDGLKYARRRVDLPLVQCAIEHAPFLAPFDLVGMFDVLEHLENDRARLQDVRALVAPERHLVLTVPAHMALWNRFDEEVHHCRRYEADQLRLRLVEAGFEVEYLTLFMAALYPLARFARGGAEIARGVRRRLGFRETSALLADLRIRPVINGLIGFALKQELPLLRARRQLTVGTSLLAVARRLP